MQALITLPGIKVFKLRCLCTAYDCAYRFTLRFIHFIDENCMQPANKYIAVNTTVAKATIVMKIILHITRLM